MSVGRHLREFTESHGLDKTITYLREALEEGKIVKDQISVRDLAEGFMGGNWEDKLRRRQARVFTEASEAVDSSGFVAITGQLLINEIKQKYKSADFVGDSLVEVIPITNGNLGTQRTPYLSDVIDEPQQVQQGKEYPQTSISPQYIDYPAPEKRGQICAVTFETIFSDLTRQMLDSAGSVGRRLGINREERILRVVLGIVNNHSWNGSSYNTYQASTPWINVKSSNELVDWTDLNEAEQLFVNMLDPVTGKPIDITPNAILVMPAYYYSARRVTRATETRSGDITSGAGNQTVAPNPLDNDYRIAKSAFAYKLLTDTVANGGAGIAAADAKKYWYIGDFKKAFVYRQVYPLRTVEAPPLNPMDFKQDIALAVKASEFGVAAVRDPRYVVKCYDS